MSNKKSTQPLTRVVSAIILDSCIDSNIITNVRINGLKVLLQLRKNTQYFAGYWSLPIGHVEADESYSQALQRELEEELGIRVEAFELIKMIFDRQQNIEQQCFKVEQWQGQISNQEPQLCEKLQWFSLNQLPEIITPSTLLLLNILGESIKVTRC